MTPHSTQKPETPPPGKSRKGGGLPSILRAFRHRNYRLFFAGQFISLCGTWMQWVAQSWLIYRLTGSAILLGVVGFSSQIPVLLFSPVAGIAADRCNRHRIMIAAQVIAMLLAFILAFLTLTGRVRVWHLPVLAALLGVVNAFDIPARQAFVVSMVGKNDLINAIALNSSMFNSARIIGPALAGLLVAAIGEGWCFFVNGVSYLAVIASLLLMHLEGKRQERPRGSVLFGIVEGFRFAWQAAPVRLLLILLGLVSLVGMPYAVLLPIFADKILHGGSKALGMLMAAAGVGALAGALVLAARKGIHGLERWIAISLGGFGICLFLFSFSRSLCFSLALMIPAGFAMIGQMASSNTFIQTIVPDALRGRIMSFYSMVFIGFAPFGSLLAGALADRFGAPVTIGISGLVCMTGALIFGFRLRKFRHDARRMIVALEMTGGNPPERKT